MSRFVASMDTGKLRGNLRKVVANLRSELPPRLRAAAQAAVDASLKQPTGDDIKRLRAFVERQLRAVFVPVSLKHRRREQWPDLWPIFEARVVRGHASYQGQSRFYVDAMKYAALREKLVARYLASRAKRRFRIDVTETPTGFRVTIRGPYKHRADSFRQAMREEVRQSLLRVLKQAGF